LEAPGELFAGGSEGSRGFTGGGRPRRKSPRPDSVSNPEPSAFGFSQRTSPGVPSFPAGSLAAGNVASSVVFLPRSGTPELFPVVRRGDGLRRRAEKRGVGGIVVHCNLRLGEVKRAEKKGRERIFTGEKFFSWRAEDNLAKKTTKKMPNEC
jgi:hypothetical protein